MRARAIEFRLRVALMAVIVTLGFWAPWIEAWGSSIAFFQRMSVLEWLALELSRLGVVRFTQASAIVIVTGALIAASAVLLRVWGSAYLGGAIVNSGKMKAGIVTSDGPYRYVRNPLYLGSWLMVVAMAFVMPPTGASFAVVLAALLLLRLVFAEEAFLDANLGEPYLDYRRAVPRLLPRLRTTMQGTGAKPHWPRALVMELNPIGVFLTLAILSWSYDHTLMIKAILISFGVSLVVRALMPPGHIGLESAV